MMKSRNLITKIALITAIAALLFSIVTLVRTIIVGGSVFLSSILVVGTAVVVAICAAMLYILRKYDPDEIEDEPVEEEPDVDPEEQSIKEAEVMQDVPVEAEDPVVEEEAAEAQIPTVEQTVEQEGDELSEFERIEASVDRLIAELEREERIG